MTKHTPGPWVAESHGKDHWEVAFDGDSVVVKMDRTGDQIQGYRKRCEADARLIAAAPDLLAAATAVHEYCPCDPDIFPDWEAAWKQLEAAIAKAEGK